MEILGGWLTEPGRRRKWCLQGSMNSFTMKHKVTRTSVLTTFCVWTLFSSFLSLFICFRRYSSRINGRSLSVACRNKFFFTGKDRTEQKLLGFSYLRLSADDSTTVSDGRHELHLHKVHVAHNDFSLSVFMPMPPILWLLRHYVFGLSIYLCVCAYVRACPLESLSNCLAVDFLF